MNPQTPRRFGAWSSSADPSKLSETVVAVAKMIAGILVFTGVLTVGESTTLLANVNQILAAIMAGVPLAYTMWNAGNAIWGLIQKAIVAKTKQY